MRQVKYVVVNLDIYDYYDPYETDILRIFNTKEEAKEYINKLTIIYNRLLSFKRKYYDNRINKNKPGYYCYDLGEIKVMNLFLKINNLDNSVESKIINSKSLGLASLTLEIRETHE